MTSWVEANNYGKEPDDDFEYMGTGETCFACGGEGGFHDCGEDACCCLDKDEISIKCEECQGSGYL